MKQIGLWILCVLLCMVLLTACAQTPADPDGSLPQDTPVSSTTESTTTTTEETTTTTEETTTTTTTTAKPTTTATTTTTTVTPTTTTATTSEPATTVASTTYTTKTMTLNPADEPPQEKRQFRYTFDGQDILFSYIGGSYTGGFIEARNLLWCYEGTANTGEKLTANVSVKKGYVQSVYYEEELSGERGTFEDSEGRQMLLAKMPDVEEVQTVSNFIGSGDYKPGYKMPLPFLQAAVALTDQKINVSCYWKGALYDGVFRITGYSVKEDQNKNPKVVEEGTLDFLYPQWV
ncbi:MAG: hypothetical protein IJC33_08080 [Clostridia bacterium]|nr:hypothetical protein [Clostridia bacterium]